MTNQQKFIEMVKGIEFEVENLGYEWLRVDDTYGNGMLWLCIEDMRDGERYGGVCTAPDSRYHKPGDCSLTEAGIEELYGWLCEKLAYLAQANKPVYNMPIHKAFDVEEAQ